MTAPIYVEVFPLLVPKLTGIGRFSCRLVQALNRLAPLRLTTFLDPRTQVVHELNCDLMRGQQIELGVGEVAQTDTNLPDWVAELCQRPKRPYDSGEAERHTGIYTWTRPSERHFGREIAILYDFTPLVVPWTHLAWLREGFYRQLAATARCEKVLAISHCTKADAAWLSAINEHDIEVAYPGPSQCLATHAHAPDVSRRSNAMLIVATREPRKNGDFLLEWFLNTEVLPDDFELWWAGPEGWLWEGPQAVRENPRFERVKFLGMVSDAELCRLYREVTFTVYPSLYEGFGFPVLDSLLHDAPVLASYNSSLAELEGSGVFYFDPCDMTTLDEAYRQMVAARPIAIDHERLGGRFAWEVLAEKALSLAVWPDPLQAALPRKAA
ncbi:MAG TPA: glycosyltransferase [Pirellulales bacterium]|jgi:glycosyltransferase involved in cell wall biosynthesis|nr:glycosyltransferase [Pirellulales bacterium]